MLNISKKKCQYRNKKTRKNQNYWPLLEEVLDFKDIAQCVRLNILIISVIQHLLSIPQNWWVILLIFPRSNQQKKKSRFNLLINLMPIKSELSVLFHAMDSFRIIVVQYVIIDHCCFQIMTSYLIFPLTNRLLKVINLLFPLINSLFKVNLLIKFLLPLSLLITLSPGPKLGWMKVKWYTMSHTKADKPKKH
jgi:hypothetical protein